jgi:hypothetical protein
MYTNLSTVNACASILQSLPLAQGVSNNTHNWFLICDGKRDAAVDVSTFITELTPELEFVAEVTVEDRPFSVFATGLEHVGGWKYQW